MGRDSMSQIRESYCKRLTVTAYWLSSARAINDLGPHNSFNTMLRSRKIGFLEGLPRLLLVVCSVFLGLSLWSAEKPLYEAELIFPLETWHNHASCIVEAPD